jgi:alcohol dehydrogenase
MSLVIGSELRVLGSHGMAAASYPAMLAEVASGLLRPDLLVRGHITLDEDPQRLASLGEVGGGAGGITVIEP